MEWSSRQFSFINTLFFYQDKKFRTTVYKFSIAGIIKMLHYRSEISSSIIKLIVLSYSCNWYSFSSKCKVILLIIMARSIRPLQLTGGKMFVLSMETYSSMLKGAGTYFTVFASQRNDWFAWEGPILYVCKLYFVYIIM